MSSHKNTQVVPLDTIEIKEFSKRNSLAGEKRRNSVLQTISRALQQNPIATETANHLADGGHSKEYDENPCIIDPHGKFRHTWDFFIAVFVVFLCITIPLQVAFGENVMKSPHWKTFNIFLDVFFWADIVLNFLTGFVHSGHTDNDPCHIASHYIGMHPPYYIPRGWLVVDLLACFPFELVFSQGYKKGRKALKLWKIFKLTKLLRMMRFLRRLPEYFKYRLVFYCVFFIFFASHSLSCIWIAIEGIGLESDRGFGWDSDRLVSQGNITTSQLYFAALDTVMKQLFLVSEADIVLGIYTNYSSTEGDKEIVWEERSGKTIYSHVLSIVFCLVGATLQSLIWALVYKLVTNQSSMREKFRMKMDHMSEEMETLQFPVELQKKVRDYYRLLWSQPDFYGNAEVAEYITKDMDLCYILKADLSKHLVGLIKGLPDLEMFKGCTQECLGVLVNKMRTHFFINGNFIWKKDTVIRELIFVYRGEILGLSQEDLDEYRTGNFKSKPQKEIFFGEKELLKGRDVRYGRYILAHSNVVYIAVFPKQTIVDVLSEFQENLSILIQLQSRHIYDNVDLSESEDNSDRDNDYLEEKSEIKKRNKRSGRHGRRTIRDPFDNRLNLVEKNIDKRNRSEDSVVERVTRLEKLNGDMDKKMDMMAQILQKMTTNGFGPTIQYMSV